MAYVSNPWDDEDEESGRVPSGMVGDPSGGVGGSGAGGAANNANPQLSKGVSGAANQMAPTGTGAAGTGSGSWTNLNAYLNANRGAGKTMAQGIADKTSQQIGQVQGGVQKVEDKTKQQIQAGTTQYAPDLVEAVKADPVKVSKQMRPQYDAVYNAQYKGPNSAAEAAGSDIAGLKTQAGNVKQRLDLYGTDSGRGQLAGEVANRSDYSRGERALDSFLLQTDGGETFDKSRKAAQGFDSGLGTLEDRIGDAIRKGKETTDQAREGLRSAVADTSGQVRKTIDTAKGQVESTNAAKQKQFNDVTDALKRKDIGELRRLGMNPEAAQFALANGWDATKLINKTRDLSLADRVDDGTIAKLGALQSLLGSQDLTGGYNFGERGGVVDPFTVNQQMIDAASQGFGIDRDVRTKRDAANQRRNDEFGGATTDAAIAQAIGLSPQEIGWIVGGGLDQDAKYLTAQSDPRNFSQDEYGVLLPSSYAQREQSLFKNKGFFDERAVKKFYDDIRSQIQRNPYLNVGDVATNDQRQAMINVNKILGINGPDLRDTQDEGAAFRGFDSAKVRSELQKKLAEFERAKGLYEGAYREYGNPQLRSDAKSKSNVKPAKFGKLMASLGRC